MSEEEQQNRFSLRKLSVGLASVLIGVSIFGTSQTVKADTVADQNTSAVTSNAQSSDTQENKNAVKSTFSSDNQANNAKSNLIQTQVEGKKDQKQDSAPKTQEVNDGSNLYAEKDIVRTNSLQEPDNQSNNHAEDNSQTQTSQKLDLTKNSPKFAKKVLATNLTETNNKLTHSYTKQGSDPSVVKTPPKSLLASWTPANTDKNQDVYLVYKDLDVSVKYVDAISGQTVKNDNFVSDPSQSVTYNYSVPDGYVLEAPAKTSTSYTFGDDKSDTPTITINLRKAIKRHYRVIENLPDGTQKIILDFNLTLPQRKDGSYGIPDFDENGNSLGEDNADPKKYDTLNKYFGGIPKMSSSNNVHINPDIGSPTNDYSCVVFEPDLVNNTTLILDKAVSPQSFVLINDKTAQFMWTTAYSGITADQNPSRDFFINYQHNTQKVTDPSQLQTTGKRTTTISMPKGHGDQMTIVQTVGYKRTGTLDLYTGKTAYTDWVFDADTSNVTVNGQPSTQYQAYVLNNGVVSYAPIKLPHINGYKAHLVRNKINPAMLMVSFVAVPTETKPSNPVEVAPSKPSANADNTNKPADDLKDLKQRVVTELNSNDSGWTMPTTADTHVIEVPTDSVSIDLSNLVIAEPVHAHTHTQIRVNKRFKLSKKHSIKHLKHRKKAVRQFKKYRL